jgi:hypothetical protein
MTARPSLQRRRQEEDPGAEDAVDAEAEAVDQRELARRTSHEPTLPAGAPARQSTVRRWFSDPRHRGSTQVPFLSMTWYGPLAVRVLCRVGLLGALRAGGCAKACGMQGRQRSLLRVHTPERFPPRRRSALSAGLFQDSSAAAAIPACHATAANIFLAIGDRTRRSRCRKLRNDHKTRNQAEAATPWGHSRANLNLLPEIGPEPEGPHALLTAAQTLGGRSHPKTLRPA